MKYCKKCDKRFDSEKDCCPICGTRLIEIDKDEIDEYETAEIVASMTTTGIL